MTSRDFPLIYSTSIPRGSDTWETRRSSILASFAGKVPEQYYIPRHFVDDPPIDVTQIPRACGILTTQELEITEDYDTVGLAAAIAARKYTAAAVTTAFVKRAIVCHQISCCLTQWFPDEAIAQAKALDEHLERTGKTVGPLHGVPISIKEHIPIAGHSSSTGYVSTIVHDQTDALMVAILRKLGAVFYVKTNQPQSAMHLESDSPYGRVLNPYNIGLSAGGSSGGEAALVALRGSVLGVGTDIGGSVRGPAGFCGIYGFKPTAYTLPLRDFVNGGATAELNILISAGPMCRSLRDMDFFMREILAQKPYLSDPRVIPIPWTGLRTDIHQPLKIGFMMTDGVITPQPPVTQALKWARTRLSASSTIELKPFHPHEPAKAISMIRQMYWPDSGQVMKGHLADVDEPMHPLSAWIIKDADPDSNKEKNAIEISKMRLARDAFRCAFAESWTAQDVDVVICPVFFGPAAAHNTSFYWNYTALWNFVDYPGAVFPTPVKAGPRGVEKYETVDVLGDEDAHVRKMWEKNNYEGAPINLQIVARKHHDNFLFGAMNSLADLLDLR